MSAIDKLEKILRNRYFCILVVPFTITLIVFVLIDQFSGKFSGITGFFFLLILGIILFPQAVFAGLGINGFLEKLFRITPMDVTEIFFYVLMLLVYVPYILFVLRAAKLKKKTLYIISAIILLFILLGVRGCVIIAKSRPPYL